MQANRAKTSHVYDGKCGYEREIVTIVFHMSGPDEGVGGGDFGGSSLPASQQKKKKGGAEKCIRGNILAQVAPVCFLGSKNISGGACPRTPLVH